MMHYYETWQSLETKKKYETPEDIYYEASTTSFSPLAITGKKFDDIIYKSVSQTIAITGDESTEKPLRSEVLLPGEPELPKNSIKYLIIGAFAGILLNATLIYKFRKSHGKRIFSINKFLLLINITKSVIINRKKSLKP